MSDETKALVVVEGVEVLPARQHTDRELLEAANARLLRRRAELGNQEDPGYQRIGETSEFAEIARRAMERVANDPEHAARVAEWERGERERKAREEQSRRESWLREESGIPREIAKALLGSSVDRGTGACDEACRALAAANRLVLLHGPPGTGKTWGACFAMWNTGLPGRFVTAFRYCQMPTWEQAADNPYAESPILVLDDLGREPRDRRGQVEELLIGRWGDGLPTLVTTNLSMEELAEGYDGRVADRLAELAAEVIETSDRLRGAREE